MSREIERAADLLNRSESLGFLSEESASALAALPRVLDELARAIGSDASGADVLLVTILVDDSGSIGTITRGVVAEEQGHDRLLKVLQRRGLTEALVHTRFLNRGIFSPYRPLSQARSLSPNNLTLSRDGTPLYRQSVLTLGSVFVKTRQLEEQGKRVRTVTLIITDGEDTNSGDITAEHVRFLVRDMLSFASNHIVAGMGIGETDFKRVFREMGIPTRFVFSAGASEGSIEKMFDAFGRDLALALESESAFRQLSAG